ncbi:MAG TPA: GAF domain-containing SpoIIE family protein phosphatase [Marmoricola sp.]|nr:GAF domain-containing SpoIIE family protein phosphatase [Marmoricola sp.]
MSSSAEHFAAPAASSEELSERLRRLEAITDTALSRLDLDKLVDELLDRVRDLLGTDTAAVLLMDESQQFLVASYARGLEEEVRQGSRVPLGRGFAGTVAATRRPVTINVNPATVVNPVLLIKRVRSMLGVPLMDGDEVVGVLHVGTLAERQFTDQDVELLEQAADRAALAIRSERARADRAAALALQRSFAPQSLPAIPGLEMAARYVPGSTAGVGGDWYDVFTLPDGRTGILIADVMGHGLRSATVMGRLRGAFRAYALEDDDPASVLSRLDREMLHFERGQTATAIYALLDSQASTLQVSTAGHIPPLFAEGDGEAGWIDEQRDLLLGARRDAPRRTTTIELPSAWTLCLFTDGLVERRDHDLDQSLERVRALLTGPSTGADDACARIMAELIGGTALADDVALLVVRRTDGA